MTPSQLLKKAILPVLGVLCYSCSEDIDTSARYVFTEETIASYLEKRPQYSQYVKLMKQVQVSPRSATTVFQLMSARGNYTCFAPNNEAVDAFMALSRSEGIIPALESSHALAHAIKIAPTLPKDKIILVCLSGRGDKDLELLMELNVL